MVNFLFLLQSMLNPSSEQADKIYKLFNYFNIAALCMFLLVTVLAAYICIKYRKKKNDERKPDQFKGNNLLEAFMIGVPTLLVVFFFYKTIQVMRSVEPATEVYPQPDIIITSHQFWWEVEYPSAKVITANEIHLPVHKKILMELRSADVIHDWWVPELGNKMDCIPGHVNHLWLNINKAATYAGLCSEFCGAQHAWMRMDIVVQNTADYNNWLAATAAIAKVPSDSLAMKGASIFQATTCANCHRVNGTPAAGAIGPDLTHLFSRMKMLAGMMPVNEANLYKWIANPQQVKPGSKMPDFIYSKDTVNALVHYMTQLQ